MRTALRAACRRRWPSQRLQRCVCVAMCVHGGGGGEDCCVCVLGGGMQCDCWAGSHHRGSTRQAWPTRSLTSPPARPLSPALQRRGVRACVGVTTGQLFCAMVGSQRRSEFTVFGDAINLAARLMVKARRGAVLCDAPTRQLAQGKAAYLAVPPLRLKGKVALVEVSVGGGGGGVRERVCGGGGERRGGGGGACLAPRQPRAQLAHPTHPLPPRRPPARPPSCLPACLNGYRCLSPSLRTNRWAGAAASCRRCRRL